MTDPGDETRAAPKLKRGTFEYCLGLFDSFAVVLANEASIPDKMNLRPDEISPVICHALRPKVKSYA